MIILWVSVEILLEFLLKLNLLKFEILKVENNFYFVNISGDESQYKFLTNSYMVHIDDATKALIFLFENANAKGRFICSSHQISFHQLHEKLSERYPQYHIPIPQYVSFSFLLLFIFFFFFFHCSVSHELINQLHFLKSLE